MAHKLDASLIEEINNDIRSSEGKENNRRGKRKSDAVDEDGAKKQKK
jgi:hypothetical protein